MTNIGHRAVSVSSQCL